MYQNHTQCIWTAAYVRVQRAFCTADTTLYYKSSCVLHEPALSPKMDAHSRARVQTSTCNARKNRLGRSKREGIFCSEVEKHACTHEKHTSLTTHTKCTRKHMCAYETNSVLHAVCPSGCCSFLKLHAFLIVRPATLQYTPHTHQHKYHQEAGIASEPKNNLINKDKIKQSFKWWRRGINKKKEINRGISRLTKGIY